MEYPKHLERNDIEETVITAEELAQQAAAVDLTVPSNHVDLQPPRYKLTVADKERRREWQKQVSKSHQRNKAARKARRLNRKK